MRSFWIKSVFAVAGFVMVGMAPAHAVDCDPFISATQELSGTPTMDPFEAGVYQRVVRVAVTNSGADPCDLRLRAVNTVAGARTLENTMIEYRLYDPSNSVLINDASTISGAYDFSIAPSQTQELLVRLEIDRPVFAEPVATNAIQRLLLSDQADTQQFDDVPLSLGVTIVSRAQLNIAGVDAPFNQSIGVNSVSFGDLEANAFRTVYLQIRSNEDVAITMDSQNDGQLAEVGGGSGRVPYTARLDGQSVDLTGVDTISRVSSGDLAGASLPLTFTIQPFGLQPSNRYRDRVTVTVTTVPS